MNAPLRRSAGVLGTAARMMVWPREDPRAGCCQLGQPTGAGVMVYGGWAGHSPVRTMSSRWMTSSSPCLPRSSAIFEECSPLMVATSAAE